MTRSKIKMVEMESQRTFSTQNGTFYATTVVLEDGTTGEVSTKTPDRWKVGDEVDYTVSTSQYGNKLKLEKPMEQRGGGVSFTSGNDKERMASICVSYAKDLCVAGKLLVDEIPAKARWFNQIIKDLENEL